MPDIRAPIPKLAPEVEIPRPRSSGAAVVAVAALAMFTAVGASAFVVRVRMAASPCGSRWAEAPPIPARVASQRARVSEVRQAFMRAVARSDDRAALELYRALPPGSDPDGVLALRHEVLLQRQLYLVEQEILARDCEALRTRIDWLKRVAPEEGIEARAAECPTQRIVEVELVGPRNR